MARETSIEAYRYVVSTGKVGLRQRQVYQVLYKYGPLTANECFEKIKAVLGKKFRFDSNTRARFTELRDMEIISEVGKQICKVTGRLCILWDVTNKKPVKLLKKETKDQKIARLEKRIKDLEFLLLEKESQMKLNFTNESR